MSDLKEIVWISGEKFIPPYGFFEAGKRKLVPEDMANEFIKSGKAEPFSKPSTKKTTPPEE